MEKEVSPESFIRLDTGCVTSVSIVGDIDIILDISNDIDNNVDNDDDDFNENNDETPSFHPSNNLVEESLNKFHNLSLFSTYSDSENGEVTEQGKIAVLKTKRC